MEQISSQEQLSRILRVFFISAGLIMCTGSLSAYSESDRDSNLSLIKGKSLKRTNVAHSNINQQRTLSGTVRNADGVPLEGVSVKVKGSTAATSTNADGQYSLQANNEANTLVFSTVGYITQEIAIGGSGVTDVTLQSDVTSIGDVVVIGYGTQKKENLTGAVSTVTSEVLESRPITTLGQGLQGTAPNLNVTQGSGAPGKGSTFNPVKKINQ